MPRYITPLLLATALCATPTLAERIPLEPGPDTTVYDAPLRDDGTVDYIAAMNAELAQGVTSENNAFVELWLVRPVARFTDADGQIAEHLGIESRTCDERFIGFFDFMADPGRGVTEDEAWEIYEAGYVGPFVGDDVPDIMAWLERNDAALDRIVEATRRPRFYVPWLSGDDDDPGNLATVMAPYLSMYREYVRALMFRIHMELGEGRTSEAIEDLCAVRDLAALLRIEPTVLAHLVAASIDTMAVGLVQTVLTAGDPTREQLDAFELGWSFKAEQTTIVQALDQTERLYTLDLLQQGWAGRLDLDAFLQPQAWLLVVPT